MRIKQQVKCVAIFWDISMLCGHDALKNLISDNFDEIHDMVLFVNKKKTAFKAMVNLETIVHYRARSGQITEWDIINIPKLFGGKALVFEKNCEDQLKQVFKEKIVKVA